MKIFKVFSHKKKHRADNPGSANAKLKRDLKAANDENKSTHEKMLAQLDKLGDDVIRELGGGVIRELNFARAKVKK